MTVRVLRLGIPALLAWTATSCLTFDPVRTVNLDPVAIERRGEGAFVLYRIPVADRIANYRVRSGAFRADEAWGPEVAERIACGGDPTGNALAGGVHVEMSVQVRISPRGSGSRVYLESSGRTVPVDEEHRALRCRLNDTFAQELLTAIAGPGNLDFVGRPPAVGPTAPPSLGPPVGGGPDDARN